MYRIMIVTSHRDKYESLYKYLTTTIDGETMPLEIETKEKLDERVEKMLNEEGYSQKDFIVVRPLMQRIILTMKIQLLKTPHLQLTQLILLTPVVRLTQPLAKLIQLAQRDKTKGRLV